MNKRPFIFKEDDRGCFLVQGRSLDKEGYAHIWRQDTVIGAHRYIWEECFGPIPEGMCVCHKCDNPSCINPEHLFLGSHADNMHDMVVKGRARTRHGEEHGNSKLTEEQVREILSDTRPQSKIAKQYNVSHCTVGGIQRGTAWAHIERSASGQV